VLRAKSAGGGGAEPAGGARNQNPFSGKRKRHGKPLPELPGREKF
jgi:hypothetical protein